MGNSILFYTTQWLHLNCCIIKYAVFYTIAVIKCKYNLIKFMYVIVR